MDVLIPPYPSERSQWDGLKDIFLISGCQCSSLSWEAAGAGTEGRAELVSERTDPPSHSAGPILLLPALFAFPTPQPHSCSSLSCIFQPFGHFYRHIKGDFCSVLPLLSGKTLSPLLPLAAPSRNSMQSFLLSWSDPTDAIPCQFPPAGHSIPILAFLGVSFTVQEGFERGFFRSIHRYLLLFYSV